MGITRDELLATARKHLGAKHRHHGRVPYLALDCAGVLIVTGKELKLIDDDFDFFDYSKRNDGSELDRLLRQFCDEVPLSEAMPGDIAVMSVYGDPQHCGFFTDHGILHALDTVVEHGLDKHWTNRLVRAFRLRGID